MRILFPNLTRPKKGAKTLSRVLSRPLAQCQSAVATAGWRQRGSIGKLKSSGRNGELVILKRIEHVTYVLTHKSPDSIVANFEFASPIRQAPLFIPMRLHLSYGAWTEKDGTRVLFSRDYKPLWRLKAGETPARLNPWDRIQFEKQEWFWDDTTTPWSNEARFEHEMNRLQDFGVTALPRLVETLPYLVLRDDLTSINDAVDLLRDKYDPVQAA
jgi:hypothetical protein